MKFIILFFISSFTWAASAQTTIDLTMVGDIGLNPSNQDPLPTHVNYYGHTVSYERLGQNIQSYMTGDLIFGNLETVISDTPLSNSKEKAFKFQSHPNGARHLIHNLGFNMFSLANNHSADYGYNGLQSTYSWMKRIASENPLVLHGLGTSNEVIQPSEFRIKDIRGAFLAIGADSFGLNNAPISSQNIGSLNYHQFSMVNAALENLKSSPADLKIISIHFGTEKQVHLDASQQQTYRDILDASDADIIIGHHPHVVRPIEFYNGKLIIYSLGNFMLLGAANIDNRDLGYDYGAMAKTRIRVSQSNVKFERLELIPLQKTHFSPQIMPYAEASRRIDFLNRLSASEVGSNAIYFNKTEYSGVWINP